MGKHSSGRQPGVSRLSNPVDYPKPDENRNPAIPAPPEEAGNLRPVQPPRLETLVIPVLEERPACSTRKVETGRLRIIKKVFTHVENVEVPVWRETLQVERVAINRPVSQPVSTRYEGDTLIISVFEETFVVEKRLILKEELRITKHRVESCHLRQVELRREEHPLTHKSPDAVSF
jgi:uncharacterized protein (TIGR02271 family)